MNFQLFQNVVMFDTQWYTIWKITFNDIFQLVHYVGNDFTMNNQLPPNIRVNSAAIRELEGLPWATLALPRLLRFSVSDHWLFIVHTREKIGLCCRFQHNADSPGKQS